MSGTAFARLPEALRLLRKRRGWTQRELAEAVGFTVKQVSAYETGRQRPRIETLERILKQLRASARVLAQTMAAFDDRTGDTEVLAAPRRAAEPIRAIRDGRPLPVRSEREAGQTARDTLRGLSERLPALRLLADELALDVVTASVERRARSYADAMRNQTAETAAADGAGTTQDRSETKPSEAK